jgi:hypothetical protein
MGREAVNDTVYIGKCYFVAPLHDTFGLDRIGWAVVEMSPVNGGFDQSILFKSKSKKSCSKLAHELNEELNGS